MDLKETGKKAEELLRPIVEALGYELVDLQLVNELGRYVLRLYADRPEGGITLDDCVNLSREIAPHLDVADVVHARYNLEVSSPGLQRPLTRREDFDRFKGELVVVKTGEPIKGRRRFKGLNLGIDEEGRVVVEDLDTGEKHGIPFDAIAKAKLDPEITF